MGLRACQHCLRLNIVSFCLLVSYFSVRKCQYGCGEHYIYIYMFQVIRVSGELVASTVYTMVLLCGVYVRLDSDIENPHRHGTCAPKIRRFVGCFFFNFYKHVKPIKRVGVVGRKNMPVEKWGSRQRAGLGKCVYKAGKGL